MKRLLFFVFVSMVSAVNSQEKFQIYTELSQGVSYYWKKSNLYSESDINVGGQLNPSKGSFIIYGKYRFGGFALSNEILPYTLNYSALGGGFFYRILSHSKKISPFVRVEILSEVKKNKNQPSLFYMDEDLWPSNPNYYPLPNYLYTNFIGNVYLGADFNVIKSFNINVGLGGSFRELRLKHYTWVSKKHLYGMSIQVGLSYSFSVKKKNSTT